MHVQVHQVLHFILAVNQWAMLAFRLSDETGKLVLTPVAGSLSKKNFDENDGMSNTYFV